MSIYKPLKVYEKNNDFSFVTDRNNYLENCIKGKTVLHIGCSDYPITEERIQSHNLLHEKLQNSAKEILGIDLSDEGINIMKKYGYSNVIKMDAENIQLENKYSTILAGDVLEHTNNPGKLLESASRVLDTNGEIIIGVPSALTINNYKAWFRGWEQVHCDHTCYFSPKTLSALCERYGLLPTKLVFTTQPQGDDESTLFVLLRKLILKSFKAMSPSIIMHFKKSDNVDQSTYLYWK